MYDFRRDAEIRSYFMFSRMAKDRFAIESGRWCGFIVADCFACMHIIMVSWVVGCRVERAYRCGVCKTVYSISPISANKWKGYRWKACKALLLVSCVLSLYYGATYPLWPLLVIFGMLTLPNIGQIRPSSKTYLLFVLVSTIAFCAVLFSGSSHVSQYIHQLHTMKDRGAPMAPVLRPGILLFASNAIRGSIFSRSVVFILEHTPMRGSQGVILNQRMQSRLERDCFIESRSGKRGHSRMVDCDDDEGDVFTGPVHLFGGPVGLPGEGPAKERLVTLHTFDSVRGSRYIQLQGEPNEKIYFGGVMSDVLREANRTNSDEYPVYIFHGISAWSPGQLESEVQSGAWNTRSVTYDELLDLIDFGEIPGTTV